MSYVGEPFKYDIFFSYPHAIQDALKEQTNMRDWSRMLADKLLSLVSVGLSEEGDDTLTYYLDRDRAETGQSLTATLEEAAQHAAILVVLMSPMYKSWCLKELDWYLERAREDGRNFDQLVLLQVLRTPDASWPPSLLDEAGKLRVFFNVTDGDGRPTEFAGFIAGGPHNTPKLAEPLSRIAQEIVDKAKRLRASLQAGRAIEKSSKKPDRWVLYLEAEPADQSSWDARRATLKPNVVLPPDFKRLNLVDRDESVVDVYRDCDALVLLRDRPDDKIYPRIRRAYMDIRTVFQCTRRELRWRILNNHPETAVPGAEEYGVECIAADDEAWADRLLSSLHDSG